MNVRAWLAGAGDGRSVSALARAAKTTRRTIMKLRDTDHIPLAATAKRIELATGGEVTAAELLGLKKTRAA